MHHLAGRIALLLSIDAAAATPRRLRSELVAASKRITEGTGEFLSAAHLQGPRAW